MCTDAIARFPFKSVPSLPSLSHPRWIECARRCLFFVIARCCPVGAAGRARIWSAGQTAGLRHLETHGCCCCPVFVFRTQGIITALIARRVSVSRAPGLSATWAFLGRGMCVCVCVCKVHRREMHYRCTRCDSWGRVYRVRLRDYGYWAYNV